MRTIPEKETLTVEFKSDCSGYSDTDLVDEIVGMANTQGGDLYLGVEDNGEITGVGKKRMDPIGAMALIANKTIPSVSTRAEIIEEEGFPVLKIEIPMYRSIVATTDGRILKRRLKLDGTPENVPLYPFEIPSRLSELNLLDYSAQVVQEASVDDLDPNERIRLRNIIKYRKGDSSLVELSDDELDKALQLVKIDHGTLKPTITGLLLIGKEEKIKKILI